MTTAAKQQGDAAYIDLHRARRDAGDAAATLAALCRDPSTPPAVISAAARQVSLSVGRLAALIHVASR
jgi:hypothetical protein